MSAAPPAQDGARIEDLLAAMTPEQRVGQMFLVTLWGEELSAASRRLIETYAPGGVVLFEHNMGTPWAVTALTNAMQEAAAASGAGVPLFVATDQEGGVTSRLLLEDGFTAFPVSQVLTAAGDPANAAAVGRAIAEELRAVGINMNLAPVADLETNRGSLVMKRRTFGADPAMAARMVAAFIEGTQAAGVVATAKHFPGHGDTAQDSHTGLPVVEHDLEALRRRELVPFQAAVDAGVSAVMAAHIWFPALEPVERRPASLSYPILTGLLRAEMGFDGLIVTDALSMNAIDRAYAYGEAATLAIEAGVDLVAFGMVGLEDQQAAIDAVIEAVRAGAIPQARIDASVRRILAVKARFGLLDWAPLDPQAAAGALNAEAHRALVAGLFPQAATLVRDDSALLPLRQDQNNLLVFLTGYGDVAGDCRRRILGLRLVEMSGVPGPDNRAAILNAAQYADTVVILTDDAIDTPQQAAVVRALPPEKTVVIALRSPYDLLAFPEVSGYVALYTPLPGARAVICDLLAGDIEPRGVLPAPLGDLYAAGDGLRGFAPRP
ncbi:MAG: hypothetical protein JXB47_00825 [Anaerolineae bacterium]|nr:hypothetical protein [Anaerolineae bacterium]